MATLDLEPGGEHRFFASATMQPAYPAVAGGPRHRDKESSMRLSLCSQCERHVDPAASRCPFCDAKLGTTTARYGASAWIMAAGFAVAACGPSGDGDSTDEAADTGEDWTSGDSGNATTDTEDYGGEDYAGGGDYTDDDYDYTETETGSGTGTGTGTGTGSTDTDTGSTDTDTDTGSTDTDTDTDTDTGSTDTDTDTDSTATNSTGTNSTGTTGTGDTTTDSQSDT